MRLRDSIEAFYTGRWAAERQKRRERRHFAHKYRLRDRSTGRTWLRYPPGVWTKRRQDPEWTFGRRKVPTDTGYGVAYERRPDKDMYCR